MNGEGKAPAEASPGQGRMRRETMATTKKTHVPATGYGHGLRAVSLCKRPFDVATGDHDLLRRQAMAAVGTEHEASYCPRCMARIKAAMVR